MQKRRENFSIVVIHQFRPILTSFLKNDTKGLVVDYSYYSLLQTNLNAKNLKRHSKSKKQTQQLIRIKIALFSITQVAKTLVVV